MELCKYLLSKEAEIIAPEMGVSHTLFDPTPERKRFDEHPKAGGKLQPSHWGPTGGPEMAQMRNSI